MSYGPTPGSQQANDRCVRELDLNLRQLAALVATVTSWLLDEGPCCRRWANEFVGEQGGHRHAGDELLTLCRRGMLVEATRIENEVFYRPTASTIAKVRAWAGWDERGEAAAE